MSESASFPSWHSNSEPKEAPKKKKIPKAFLILLVIVLIISLVGLGVVIFNAINEFRTNQLLAGVDNTTPYSVRFSEVGSDNFTITWKTKSPTLGFIKYGPDSLGMDLIGQAEENPGETRTEHSIKVSGLESGQKYFIEIHSNAKAFGKDGLPLEIVTLD
jgi:hypothetical protein